MNWKAAKWVSSLLPSHPTFTPETVMSHKDFYWRRQWHATPVLLPGKSMDGGAWKAAVHGVTKSQTRLSDFTFTFYFHALEKEMATHSSVLAWRIPGMGKPGGLPSMGLHRVRHDWSDLAAAAAAIPFSRVSSQPRDWTQVSRSAGGFFTSWATRKAPNVYACVCI